MAELAAIEALSPIGGLRLSYDAFLVTVGFESRSIYAAKTLEIHTDRRIACAFSHRQVRHFKSNRAWLFRNGFDVQEVQEDDVEAWTKSIIEELGTNSAHRTSIRMCVDISSMSRARMASVLNAVLEVRERSVEIDFVYCLAKWSPPSTEAEPIGTAGAVIPAFAGWSTRTDLPIVALIGLGYEPDKAIGAYEYLEATDVWAFLPKGEDGQYARDLNRANRTLLTRLVEHKRITYRVDQPVACFGVLESVVYGLLSNSRPVLLPFGPKVFALSAMLVACRHREVPVWRISSDQFGEPLDREASGNIVGIRVAFSRRPSDAELTEDQLRAAAHAIG